MGGGKFGKFDYRSFARNAVKCGQKLSEIVLGLGVVCLGGGAVVGDGGIALAGGGIAVAGVLLHKCFDEVLERIN